MTTERRFFLKYKGGSIELPVGVTGVGRHLSCRLRFHDSSISRNHLRFIHRVEELFVEDLQSRNGTFVNGERVTRQLLKEGDLIQLGERVLEVACDHDIGDPDEPQTLTGTRQADEIYNPKETVQMRNPLAGDAWKQRCPQCGTSVTMDEDECRVCGHIWGQFTRSSTKVEDIEAKIGGGALDAVRGRRHERIDVALPLVYRSETLELEAQTRDLSVSGVFVQTNILDAEGTECNLTILVDGGPPIDIRGRVVRVVWARSGEEDSSPGLGVEFIDVSANALAWLDALVKRHAAAAFVL